MLRRAGREHKNLANRAAFVLTVVALVAGSLTVAAWLILGMEFAFAVERERLPSWSQPVLTPWA